ncbi:MAG TPA: o-succinylbenzoate synthase [Bacteroidales bacterium]
MFKAHFKKHTLVFKKPGGTSRGILTTKDSWFIFLKNENQETGIGECSIIKGLSIDDRPDFEIKLEEVCKNIENFQLYLDSGLNDFPAIRFGLEMALLDLKTGGNRVLFSSDFTSGKVGIPINGLIWMGSFLEMKEQIISKIEDGFRCLKLKIGAINFGEEIRLLKLIRKEFSSKELEIRVDANGAFRVNEALEKLKILSKLEIHSIEQPIRAGQVEEMEKICRLSPIPVALDEELIGLKNTQQARQLLEEIEPQFVILKPSLLGGISKSEEIIKAAKKLKIGWWATSALEANIGLNAIAQWVFTLKNPMPQGLGTGQLFENNIPSPLVIKNASLFHGSQNKWQLDLLNK